MRRVIMDDLQLNPYKKQSVQVISESSKLESLDRGKLMLREMKPATTKIFICSDKKMSTVVAVTNKQHYRVFALSSGDSPANVWSQFRRKKPVCDIVWAADASDVSKSRLVFIDEGLKVNSQVYLDYLLKKVISWLTETFENK